MQTVFSGAAVVVARLAVAEEVLEVGGAAYWELDHIVVVVVVVVGVGIAVLAVVVLVGKVEAQHSRC